MHFIVVVVWFVADWNVKAPAPHDVVAGLLLFEIMDKLPLLHNSTNLNIPDLTFFRRERGLTPNHMMIGQCVMAKTYYIGLDIDRRTKILTPFPSSKRLALGCCKSVMFLCNVILSYIVKLFNKYIHTYLWNIQSKIKNSFEFSLTDSIRHSIKPFYNI